MVLGKLPVPGRPTIWIRVGQGPTLLCLQWVRVGVFEYFFSRLSFLTSFFPSQGAGPI